MAQPTLTIDLDKIAHNARVIVDLCRGHGIEVTGVTKGTCGHPAVARAMLRGGVSSLGESHLENVQRLRAAGIDAPFMLLRLPPLSEVDDVVEAVDVSLNSELDVLRGLSAAAERRGRRHDVVLMVDLGDLREGIWPDEVLSFVRDALPLPGIRLRGIGANLACFGAVAPTRDNMARLAALADEVERTFRIELPWVSGANSSGLELIAAGGMPRRVNHARIGEGILLGRETVQRRPWPGTHQDAFVLHAEVLELRCKPSVPVGEPCEDAFGRHPVFASRGERRKALLNVGREDVDIEGLTPLDAGIEVLGGSSDYLVLDVTDTARPLHVGDRIGFLLNYGALLAATNSEFVRKHAVGGNPGDPIGGAP